MKWTIGLIVLAGGGSVVLAFVFLDGASAALFAFATLVVIVLGAAPVVFGVVTRRADKRARRGSGPTVVSMRDEDSAGPEPDAKRSRPGRGRDRGHRRPRG